MENREAAETLDETHPIRNVEEYIEKYQRDGLSGDDLWNKVIEKALTTDPEVDDSFLK